MNLVKIVAGLGITGALAAGAIGVGTGVASAEPGIAPVPAWGPPPPPGPYGPHDRGGWDRHDHAGWNHPEWAGWNNGYPAPGWIPPRGWEAPGDWFNPTGWAPPVGWNPCGGPIRDILHPFRCL